jgi:hypothetical protein
MHLRLQVCSIDALPHTDSTCMSTLCITSIVCYGNLFLLAEKDVQKHRVFYALYDELSQIHHLFNAWSSDQMDFELMCLNFISILF